MDSLYQFQQPQFAGGQRQSVQSSMAPQQGGGGGGGLFGSLLGLASVAAPFIPGMQVAAPFLGAANAVYNGGAIPGVGAGQSQEAPVFQNAETSAPPPVQPDYTGQQDEGIENMPAFVGPEQEAPPITDPRFMTPEEEAAMIHQQFMQNPYLLLASMQGGSLPGMGFSGMS